MVVFFFKQKTAYEMRISDWSSDVCSSDLIEAIHLKAWQIGLKAIAIYRDGSKLSQPLNLSLPADSIASTAPAGDQPMSFGDRLRLPARRRGYTQKATVGGHRLYLRTGEYPDGNIGEIFIDRHKEGERKSVG